MCTASTAIFRSWTALGAESDPVSVADTTAPTVSGVSSTLADGSYKAGQVVPVTVHFSESVVVDRNAANRSSRRDRPTGSVNYSSGSGTSTLTFNYTVQSGDTSSDLNYVATTSLTLNGGTIARRRRQQRDADPAGAQLG